MSNDKSLAIVPKGFAEVSQLSESLSTSALLPDALKKRPEDVMFTVMAGAELGLGPIASIRGIYIIQGKPVLSADTMVALVMGSGLCEYFVQLEASATSVTFETKRKGSPVSQKCTWTMEDAKRAGLNAKDTWRLYPRQMLASRARAELARSVYSDLLAGVYDPDEIQHDRTPLSVVRSEPDAVDAEIVSETPSTPLIEQMRLTTTVDELMALAAKCNALPPKSAERNMARAEFDAQKARLMKSETKAEAATP